MPIDYRRERDVNSISDDVVLDLGNGSDAALVLRSTALSADAELGSVIVGTSDHPGVAANSLIISDITADGDIMMAVQSGGNTTMSMLLDASAGNFVLQGLDLVFGSSTASITGVTTLLIGGAASQDAGASGVLTQIMGTSYDDTAMAMGAFRNNSGSPVIYAIKSRNATIGSHTVVADNDNVFVIEANPDAGVDYATAAARYVMQVDDASPEAGGVGMAHVWSQQLAGSTDALRETMRLSTAGSLLIGDTANANMTIGLTINQAATDDDTISLKSSDVTHGITTRTETDTYGRILKVSGANGGLFIEGFADTGTIGLELQGNCVSGDTDKDTGARGIIETWSAIKNGTGIAAPGSDSNIVVFHDNSLARFIFDVEGSAHADVEWVAYAEHDDLALVKDIEQHLLGVESPAGTYNRHMLEQTGIIGKDSWHMQDGKPRAMVNTTKLAMLHHGALMQVGDRIADLEEKLALAESKLAAIGA